MLVRNGVPVLRRSKPESGQKAPPMHSFPNRPALRFQLLLWLLLLLLGLLPWGNAHAIDIAPSASP